MENPEPKADWSMDAKTLWRDIFGHWDLDPGSVEILRTACDSLTRYHRAAEILANEGLVIKTENLVRKHPACEIVKNERAGFLQSLKALGLEVDEEKPSIGRPGSYLEWRKRGKA